MGRVGGGASLSTLLDMTARAASRPVGNVTRGTTNPNRLRRMDRWIAAAHGAGERGEKFADREVAKVGSDGTITKDQYLAAAQARFAKLDKNGDGYITSDEVPAGRWAHKDGAQSK